MTIRSHPRQDWRAGTVVALIFFLAAIALFLYAGYLGLRQLTSPLGVATITSCHRTSDTAGRNGNYSYSCTGRFTGDGGQPQLSPVYFGVESRDTPVAGTTMTAYATSPPHGVSVRRDVTNKLFLGGIGVLLLSLVVRAMLPSRDGASALSWRPARRRHRPGSHA